jgi:hypothetical protein
MTYDQALAKYGDPTKLTFEAENIVSFDLPFPLLYGSAPVHRSRAHKLAVPNFVGALTRVRDLGLADLVPAYGGIFQQRSIRGHAGHLSAHSWGCAVDLCPSQYPLGSKARFDSRIVDAFTFFGFTYGGDFHSRLDPMHFSLLGF